jgi:hypothetical protein
VTLTEIQHQSGAAVSAPPSWLLVDRAQTDLVDYDVFASIYNNGNLTLLASWLPEFVRRHVNRPYRWSVNDSREAAPVGEQTPLFMRLKANIGQPGEMQHRPRSADCSWSFPSCLPIDRD